VLLAAGAEADLRRMHRHEPGPGALRVRPATGGIGTAEEGFAPWVAFAELETALPTVSTKAAGVYVVVRDEDAAPRWLMPSPVGETWHGDPTVSVSALDANWVVGASVAYIGKAKQEQLRKRLRAYLRFGQGRGGRHWGGRLIWQLDDA